MQYNICRKKDAVQKTRFCTYRTISGPPVQNYISADKTGVISGCLQDEEEKEIYVVAENRNHKLVFISDHFTGSGCVQIDALGDLTSDDLESTRFCSQYSVFSASFSTNQTYKVNSNFARISFHGFSGRYSLNYIKITNDSEWYNYNVCKCDNGVVSDTDCLEDGAQNCARCNEDYELYGGKCVPNGYCDLGSRTFTGSINDGPGSIDSTRMTGIDRNTCDREKEKIEHSREELYLFLIYFSFSFISQILQPALLMVALLESKLTPKSLKMPDVMTMQSF